MDKLVIDIETSNTFADIGGSQNMDRFNVSLVGIYSYNRNEYLAFEGHQLEECLSIIQKAGLIIGFAINRFDVPILNSKCNYNMMAMNRLDLLDEIELASGRRISLNILSQVNLGASKLHESGLEAIKLFKEGRIQELKDYCLQDVKLTKDLYELIKKQGYVMVPDKITGVLSKVNLNLIEADIPATLF
ncbi:MAG: ribonuclease H-like domain-containing protein [Patescibacteria group bacterium]